ncbi:MAG TPA: PqqD family protein [Pseudolabrys sp.]|nr:PqqD family protein [Candidatus Saccharimonadales bacterium]HVZ53825.1 PqqD family protein [Pseudolabrys sp.]
MAEVPGVKLIRNERLFHAPVGTDESVMLDSEGGRYFGLNAVGTYIWGLLEQPHSASELQAAVCAEFEVDPATCETDLSAFLDSMIANGIVHEAQA